MRASYPSESAMYPEVARWLENFLRARYPSSAVEAFPTPNERLYRALARIGVPEHTLPAEWQSWDVQVDIVGLISNNHSTEIALVECKITPITIAHLSQAIGYSRIVRPRWSFLVSPRGVRPNLSRLINAFNRQDILVYLETPRQPPRTLILARWDARAQQIDWSSLIPAGAF